MDSNAEKAIVPSLHRTGTSTDSPAVQRPALSKTRSVTSAALGRVTSHLTTRSIVDPGPPPDGGLTAWVQVFCAWLGVMNTWGFVNSYGALQPYYTEILTQAPSTISWIGSVQAFLMFFLGMFSGRALDAGYFRPTIIIGISINLVGMFTMSLAQNYWQLLLTHGVCTGLGGGIYFIPSMGVAATYFDKRRGLALGLVTTGNSVGGIVYPLVIRQLLDRVGFGWTVRVLGFINVVCLAVVVAFMKPRLPPRKSGPLLDMDAFRDTPYMLQVLGLFFIMPPVYFVFYYIASFARDELGMPYTTSLNLVILVNGVGLPARILPGYIADRYLGIINTMILCLLANVIMLWCWLPIKTIPSFYAFTVLYGLFSAALQSLFSTVIAAYSDDIMKTGTRLGMAFGVMGFAALIGGPISGALVRSGGYRVAMCWAGACCMIAMGFCIAARVAKWGWGWRTKC
ncbi:major facilitator superfamily domain-containing protein [Massariosphaeria phaeospora]|uniref:Major facilitator superfamily domain-containing protein n=1 Tax=Massariosphaeria phaeospora TaxID=100035 RepID=A0A7C8IG91_9PLEO|nr:major facilitator superfamily domain-containing protein [Massariosphaeria phaeospora]